jgi:hypothetical protein
MEEVGMVGLVDMDNLVALEGMVGKLVLSTYLRRRNHSPFS